MTWKQLSSRALASQKLNSGFDPCIGKNKREKIKKLYAPCAKHAEDTQAHRSTENVQGTT